MDLADAYTEHALRLVRISNGQSRDVAMQLNKLASQIRLALLDADVSSMNERKLRALLKSVTALTQAAFASIADLQERFVRELMVLESRWAARTGRWETPEAAAVARAADKLTVGGLTQREIWERQAALATARMIGETRLGRDAGQSSSQIAQRIVGTRTREDRVPSGGALEATRRDARGIVDATTHSSADAGRREAMRATGVNALQWLAILDPKVCPNCAMRMGKLWTLDGEPIKHDIPFASPVLHPWCRCILLPMKFPADKLEAAAAKTSQQFDKWLGKLPQDRQEDLLGKGRAQLWRDGTITTRDLIDQNGMVMSLRDLRKQLDEDDDG